MKNLLQQEKYLSPALNYVWQNMLITCLLIYMILYYTKIQHWNDAKKIYSVAEQNPT
jgi:hypothetical protein